MKHFLTLLHENAKENSYQIAIESEQQSISYRQLVDLVKRCSSLLKNHYLIRERDRIAILFYPCIESIILMLSIWKIGAIYVPVPPNTSEERKKSLLSMIEPSLIVIKEPAYFASVPVFLFSSFHSLEDITVNKDDETVFNWDTCYLVSTSGSTGTPKLVMISGRSISHLVNCLKEPPYLWEKEDIVLQYSNSSFGPHVREIVGTLSLCKTLVLVPFEKKFDFSYIANTIKKFQVTRVHMTPSIFNLFERHITDSNSKDQVQSIKWFTFGGESLYWKQVKQLRTIIPGTDIGFNYAQSESMTHSSFYTIPIDIDLFKDSDLVPIGYPRQNLIFKLENQELVIRGDGLSHGYYKTLSNSFDIHSSDLSDIEYRTGDCVIEQNGCYQFLSRLDDQIKINGLFVNVEDVSNSIRTHPQATKVVVFSISIDSSSTILCSLIESSIVSLECKERMVTEIRQLCSKSLPSYSIPSVFKIVDSIPLNSNGKIDRQKAKELVSLDDDKYQETRSQSKISTLIRDMISIPLKEDTPFQEIGINSIQVLSLISRLATSFPTIEFNSSILVKYNTVRLLSDYIETSEQKDTSSTSTSSIGVLFSGSGISSSMMGMSFYHKHHTVKQWYDEVDLYLNKKYGFSILEIIQTNPKSISLSPSDQQLKHYRYIFESFSIPADCISFPFNLSNQQGVLHEPIFQQIANTLLNISRYYDIRQTSQSTSIFVVTGFSLGEISSVLSLYPSITSSMITDWIDVSFIRAFAYYIITLKDERIFRTAYLNLGRLLVENKTTVLLEIISFIETKLNLILSVLSFNVNDRNVYLVGERKALIVMDRLLQKDKYEDDIGNIGNETNTTYRFVTEFDFAIPYHTKVFEPYIPSSRSLFTSLLTRHPLPNTFTCEYVPSLIGKTFRPSQSFLTSFLEKIPSYKNDDLKKIDNPNQLQTEMLIELLSYLSVLPLYFHDTIEEMIKTHSVSEFIEVSLYNNLTSVVQTILKKRR